MLRPTFFFALAAILSVVTFYFKSDHLLDLHLAIPVGLYFIGALLLTWRPRAPTSDLLLFAGSALLLWLVLFIVSYNALFFVMVPLAGGLGAWGIGRLGEYFLGQDFTTKRPLVITGIIAGIVGLVLMIATKELPKETFTVGFKAGLIVAAWQAGVGLQLTKMLKTKEA